MKIGPYNLQLPWRREQALDIDTAPIFGKSFKAVAYKLKGIKTYYELYREHDLVRGMLDDLSESAGGQGIYTTVENVSPVLEKNRGKKLCDDFGEKMNLDEILPKIAKNMLIAGFCPVETKLMSDPKKCMLKVVHPQTVIEIKTDPFTGDILNATQKVGDQKKVLDGKNLAWFTYGNLANDPRGISFIHSILELLTTLDNATNIVSKIAERYISPIAVWKSRMPSANLKKAVVDDREEGDAIFLGSQTPDEMKEDTVKFYQVDPRVPFWDYMENLELRVYAYSRASNIWYTKNANLASAEKMEDIVARHVASIQRNIKRTVEKVWFEPLISMNGFDIEDIPRVNFGKEPTGVEDLVPSEIITTGMQIGYINQPQFYEIMRQMGIKITETAGAEEEEETGEEKPEEEEEEEEGGKIMEKRHLESYRIELGNLKDTTRDLSLVVGDLQDFALRAQSGNEQLNAQKLANLRLEHEFLTKINEKLGKKKR